MWLVLHALWLVLHVLWLVLHVLWLSLSRPSPYTLPSGSKKSTQRGAKPRVYGWMGLVDGMDGVTKVSFNFLYTLWVYRLGTYLLIYVLKNCHQHTYGFKNLMSSWGVGILFSKLPSVRVFLIKINHAKSIGFQLVIWRVFILFVLLDF